MRGLKPSESHVSCCAGGCSPSAALLLSGLKQAALPVFRDLCGVIGCRCGASSSWLAACGACIVLQVCEACRLCAAFARKRLQRINSCAGWLGIAGYSTGVSRSILSKDALLCCRAPAAWGATQPAADLPGPWVCALLTPLQLPLLLLQLSQCCLSRPLICTCPPLEHPPPHSDQQCTSLQLAFPHAAVPSAQNCQTVASLVHVWSPKVKRRPALLA